MTRAEITAFFPNVFTVPRFGGLNYAVPTLAWVRGPFWDFFHGRLWDEGLQKWMFRFECRDFARLGACAAQECWARTPGGPSDSDALALGEFWYHPDANAPGEDHAIWAVICDMGLVFIEPQDCSQQFPSDREISSCTFIRF
jgi:hypothetical protein